AGPPRARLLPYRGREQPAVFPGLQRAMKAQERGRLHGNRGTNQPVRAHEERTHASHDAIAETEIRRSFPRPIENEQLLFEEHRFDDHRTAPPGPASRAMVVSRWRARTARSRTRQS